MSKRAFQFFFALEVFLGLFFFAGCGTTEPSGIQQARIDHHLKGPITTNGPAPLITLIDPDQAATGFGTSIAGQ